MKLVPLKPSAGCLRDACWPHGSIRGFEVPGQISASSWHEPAWGEGHLCTAPEPDLVPFLPMAASSCPPSADSWWI